MLAGLTYSSAVATFGQHGAAEPMLLVGLYCMAPVTLNAFDVFVPDPEG